MREPKSLVLPLHHRAIFCIARTLFLLPKQIQSVNNLLRDSLEPASQSENVPKSRDCHEIDCVTIFGFAISFEEAIVCKFFAFAPRPTCRSKKVTLAN